MPRVFKTFTHQAALGRSRPGQSPHTKRHCITLKRVRARQLNSVLQHLHFIFHQQPETARERTRSGKAQPSTSQSNLGHLAVAYVKRLSSPLIHPVPYISTPTWPTARDLSSSQLLIALIPSTWPAPLSQWLLTVYQQACRQSLW